LSWMAGLLRQEGQTPMVSGASVPSTCVLGYCLPSLAGLNGSCEAWFHSGSD
jgi:hypothetical protein